MPSGDSIPNLVRTSAVVANCAPQVLSAMLPETVRGRFDKPYAGLKQSMSLFCVHFGMKPDAGGVLPRDYSSILLPGWMRALADYAEAGAVLGSAPNGRLPPVGVVNYGLIDSRLGDGTTSLVTVTGIDRIENWRNLSREQEAARREAWANAIEEELERHWPGFSALVSQRHFVSSLSMQRYLRTPGGAVYGFATPPPGKTIWFGRDKSPKTALPGVYLASSYGGSGGYSGTLGTGAMAGDMVEAWLKREHGRG